MAREERNAVLALHRNAQRLLKPLAVVNAFADRLTFLDDKTRTRRDHQKYLTLIRAIALLHQHQREVKTIQHNGKRVAYIEATLADIETANRLAHEVLGRTLDELPPQTRRLLHLIHERVSAQCTQQAMGQRDYRFSRREVREATGWGNTQLKVHLQRLVELEYLLIHRAGHAQRHLYELLYDGEPGASETHLNGLIDVARLRDGGGYDANRSGSEMDRSGKKANRSASGRPAVGAQSVGGRAGKNGAKPNGDKGLPVVENDTPETALIRPDNNTPSYRSDTSALLANGAE